MKQIVFFIALMAAAVTAGAQVNEIPRSTPLDEGVQPVAVQRFVDTLMAIPRTHLHHVMVLRHDKVIAEAHPAPFTAGDLHTLYSCSKTITALAVGRLIDEHRLSLDDRVVALLPDKCPPVISDPLASMTVRHLLTMSAGIRPTLDFITASDDWAGSWMARPVEEQGRFQYDSVCTFVLGMIVQRLTGMTLLDYVKLHFFEPMHITQVDWELSPDGYNTAGFGLRLQAESMAKIGLLILHRGNWQGRQLVSEAWIDEMTAGHINYKNPGPKPTDTNQGYCYQMWRCLLPGAVRADGAYGQFIVIMPEQEMVVVMTGMSEITREELRAIWQQLVPGVDAAPAGTLKQQRQLERHLAGLTLPVTPGKKSQARLEKQFAGQQLAISDTVRHFNSISFNPGNNGYTLVMTKQNGTTAQFHLTHGAWSAPVDVTMAAPYHNGAVPVDMDTIAGLPTSWSVSGNYAWTGEHTLTMKLYWTGWIAMQTLTVDFSTPVPTVTLTDNFPR